MPKVISEKAAIKLINNALPKLVKALDLTDWDIAYSTTRCSCKDRCFGETFFISDNAAFISLNLTMHPKKEELLVTLYHELLHIRLYPFKLDDDEEENLVQHLEKSSLKFRKIVL
jgi:hypothetical protein